MNEELNLFEKITNDSKIESLKTKENFSKTFTRVFLSNSLAKYSLAFLLLLIFILFVFIAFLSTNPFLKTDNISQIPSSDNFLGTDLYGRDVWSRLWFSIIITFVLATTISAINIFIACLISFSVIYWTKSSYFFRYLVKAFRVLPSLLILILLTLLFQETYAVILISFVITGWSIPSEKIDKEIKKLNEKEYLWKSQTLGSKNINSIFSLFILMIPFLIYEFFKNIPLIIFIESTIGVMGIHNANVLTIGSVLGESLKTLDQSVLPTLIILITLVTFLGVLQAFVVSINKDEFYLERGELK